MKPFQLNFLHIALILSVLFIITVISPFLTTLLLAAILVTGAYPLYEWLVKKVGNRPRIAAAIIALTVGVIFSVAFLVFFILLAQEAVSTYLSFEQWIRAGKFNLNEFVAKASVYIGIPPVDIISSITSAAQTFSTKLVTQSTDLLKSIVWLLGNLLLLIFTMYFFFKDGDFFVKTVENAIPLPRPYGREIFNRFRQISLAMLYGIFLTAIAQGILGGLGLWIAGIRNPIFWGTVMGFAGMLPIFGTALVWAPSALFLLATQHYISGIGLLLWGALIVGLVDNFVKPLIISKQTKIYPLATFLVVIGGLMVFGLKGAVIAPMVLAALTALVHIYQMEDKAPSTSIS